jgi:hypothetical protein
LDSAVITRFRALEQILSERFPEARKEAEVLANGIADPRTADADAVWAKIWDKPLFANTKVKIGADMVQRLDPYMLSAWQHWGTGGTACSIEKIGKGSGTSAFEAVNPQAREIRQKTGIAMYRLFAIQGAAKALRIRAKKSQAPYADLIDLDPSVTVPTVQREMGPGWGHITVLHFLTNLGLACKPDLHLVRTVRHLGMSLDLRDQKVPSLADAITINRRVRSLVEKLDGSLSPSRLRYVDKTLMDISSRGLIKSEAAVETTAS